ncbi:hypothetical protein FSST1_000256 [Fusarium sambucinum]
MRQNDALDYGIELAISRVLFKSTPNTSDRAPLPTPYALRHAPYAMIHPTPHPPANKLAQYLGNSTL